MVTTMPIDEYLAALDEPKRTTLTSLRDTIMAIVPDAEQSISFGLSARSQPAARKIPCGRQAFAALWPGDGSSRAAQSRHHPQRAQ